MICASRKTSLGFAQRTKENLDFIRDARQAGNNVHEVVQITNSLLGLVIFPWETTFFDSIKSWKLTDLEANGWPVLQIKKGPCGTLEKLIWHIRNGAAHGHIKFLSDSPEPSEVAVTIRDRPTRPKNAPFNFQLELTAEEMRSLCYRIIEAVDQVIN